MTLDFGEGVGRGRVTVIQSYFCSINAILFRPTELDALVFGHLFTLLTTPLPDSGRIVAIIKQHRNLVDLCQVRRSITPDTKLNMGRRSEGHFCLSSKGIDKEFFDRSASSDRSSENFERI